ncbi:hypothetical protein ACGFMK_13410 [Amycolatopsis sp. NPDC049252]|uniref:GAP1-N2 domain-containing protein n=1 Tax=Amycolatopsis sp. NPDC049252 TaxID=3363933 RepID=UPI003722FCAF
MSGPAEFDSLYYTDCVPGQGLRGGAGFQFQAVSSGVSHDVMSLVQRTSLYEAPVAWMREQRPVAEYPPSLTHVHDEGVYTTARGRYLGAEANGVREGNQFTHAIATKDVESYGLTRPAQLWAAPLWEEEPAATTQCDTVPAEPEPGVWSVDALREWVLGRPDGEEWLLAVHSAFDRIHAPDGRRVLFVGDDATTVAGWIAAGTVLLAQSRALRIGFRVFATNPRQSRHDVLAVHDDWAGPLGNPERDNGFVVFNLTTGRHSAVEPTDGARHWVPRFLRGDPYDAVDAIELTQRFAATADRPSAADRLAASVVALGEAVTRPAQVEGLVTWLGGTAVSHPEEVLSPIVDGVLAARPPLPVLRNLHQAIQGHALTGEPADRVVAAVFAAELGVLTGSAPAAPGELGALAEAAANAVPPERMNDLLVLTARFEVRPRIAAFAAGAHRFVRWWADHPDTTASPGRWPCGAELIDLLRDELTGRLDGPHGERHFEDVRRHWWKYLLSTATDPATILDATVTSAAMAAGDSERRDELFDHVSAKLREQPPAVRGQQLWRALFTYSPPTLPELTRFLEEVPTGSVVGWLEEHVGGALDELIGDRPDADGLNALALVRRLGVLPVRAELAACAQEDVKLRNWLKTARGGQPAPATLKRISEPVLTARAAQIVAAFLDGFPLSDAIGLVELSGPALAAALLRELPRHWEDGGGGDTAVALTFVTIGVPATSETAAIRAESQLAKWVKLTHRTRLAAIGKLLGTADEQLAADWGQFVRGRPAAGQTERAKRVKKPPPSRGDRAPKKEGGLLSRLPRLNKER